MFRSMFSRLLAVILAAIVLCVILLFGMFIFTMRASFVDTRMNELKMQAYDIAYMASQVRSNTLLSTFSHTSVTERYISWKADTIYKDFDAYSVVVDRSGQISVYVRPEQIQDKGLVFNRQHIAETLSVVLQGEEVVRQQDGPDGPMFTVAVPWVDDGVVLGAVYIQTAAQTVYAPYRSLAFRTALTALAILLLTGTGVFFITRQMVKPLRVMAQAAGDLANGRFDRRVPETGSLETQELASAFNVMAAQMETLEQTRRDFVANVSHELRSPMTSIQGFLQGMLDGTIPSEEHGHYMEIALSETQRVSRLVASLLSLSRMESSATHPDMSDFDIHELIRRVIIANVGQLDEKHQELSLSFGDKPLFVHADTEQIEQVLVNLVTNAIRYTPESGNIRIDTRQEGKTVYVTVRDDGPGVSEEDAPYIFDRFYRADKSHTAGGGTGLGLAICKRILEKHGQSIRLLPADSGAAFEFTLESGHAET